MHIYRASMHVYLWVYCAIYPTVLYHKHNVRFAVLMNFVACRRPLPDSFLFPASARILSYSVALGLGLWLLMGPWSMFGLGLALRLRLGLGLGFVLALGLKPSPGPSSVSGSGSALRCGYGYGWCRLLC